jgi:glycosyltransferase involved in cell wall biosynthesis
MTDISIIILCYNEEKHLQRCIENVHQITDRIFIVDCFSTDKSIEIAEQRGAIVYQNIWPGLYASQFNWALDNLPIETKWIFRLDADEYLTDDLIREINIKLRDLPEDVSGIVLKRRHIFLNKWVKHGVYPVKLLRIFKYGHGRCEQRFMDEHISLNQGKTIEFKHDFIDHNLNNIEFWIRKHSGYSVREAIDLLDIEYGLTFTSQDNAWGTIGSQAIRKRSLKHLYANLPLFFRSFCYFFYRYVIRLGFLDGKAGFLWHFFQGWWYRTLVDVRIWEVKKACGDDKEKIRKYVKEKFGYEI